MDNSKKYQNMGFGLGLRKEHYQDVIDSFPAEGSSQAEGSSLNIDWFEILTENYLVAGGKPLYFLDKIAERYPMAMHGVSMNIGNTGALDKDYLKQVKLLKNRINAHWLSDHLCWTGTNGTNAHDLLPLPYTEEAIKHVVERIQQVQDFLGGRMLIENVSSYVSYKQSEMTEWEFLSEIAHRADCLLLLDINNIYVSAVNHEFDPLDYLLSVPRERVQQFHLAGHSDYGDYIIDTHDMPVCDAVWSLYAKAVEHFGDITFMIERDDNIPPLATLLMELNMARSVSAQVKQSGYESTLIQNLQSRLADDQLHSQQVTA
ncbi:MAG: DUF692 domain-containing protein [gamma proteobacterium symbiont of Bathyaustriella thionipta]|nr:DUF692 domain-containing protein [gamma proteobacterium symbiont of Bathyaustriella thionipta]MCU7950366.1 DUF692 domain-containing protein [gamma proteobacterium symbiont of Bathyaustriella thionipta]MCU7951860.1 DUF692 domain-containing protein [gamma proteobacterium symbiont of Bathyaustriella thionipta]MCU7956110.1 DUF692 domain-containing protein [gamma proteobacterium symbiont of Bathyaustriella thionipta]MCU7966469.1 DUF692 domain-containing protein [gamma proteobacterium symbiont of 